MRGCNGTNRTDCLSCIRPYRAEWWKRAGAPWPAAAQLGADPDFVKSPQGGLPVRAGAGAKMRKKITITESDRIAIIAPHPDDECIFAAGPLLLAPSRTDIFVLTDGSHGNRERPIKEEAAIRKKQFDAEMDYIKPHAAYWFGVEDTKLPENAGIVSRIDFRPYTRIFLPWVESLHPDHRVAAELCINEIRKQGCHADCYSGEVYKPFPMPSHYIDITSLADEKRRLIRFHEDQAALEEVVLALNAFRAAQMMDLPECKFAECYDQVGRHALPAAAQHKA